MKIVVMGTGAMATLFGGRMLQRGHQVYFISGWQEQIDAINGQGIHITGDNEDFTVPAKAFASAEELLKADPETPDLILVLCKAPQTDHTIRRALPVIGENTLVLTLQNGVGNADVIAKYVPTNKIFTGCASVASEFEGSGWIKDRTNRNRSPLICIMPMDEIRDARCDLLQDLFNSLGYPTLVDGNVETQIWTKLTVNCCANAVSAITRLENCIYANDRNGFSLLNSICREIVQVAQAKKINLHYEEVRSYVHVTLYNQHHYTSMLQDIYYRRPTEVETINGAIVRQGLSTGIPTPVNETLMLLIRMISSHYNSQWM